MSRRKSTLGGVNIHGSAGGAKPTRSENLDRLADARRAANLVKDLRAPVVPLAVARSEAKRIKALGRALAAGHITIADVRAELRGAA